MIWDFRGLLFYRAIVAAVAVLTPTMASGFNTVIDAPPTVIGDNESIGSDTQLNVFDSGSVGDDFFAGAPDGSSTNVEVNISGGNVGQNFSAHGGSTVNVSGGNITSIGVAGGVLNISGGVVNSVSYLEGASVAVSGGFVSFLQLIQGGSGQVATISGGNVGSISVEDGEAIVSGGTVARLETSEPFTTITMTGGEVTGNVLVGDLSTLNLSGGTFGGSFSASEESTLNLFGTSFLLNGAPIPGLNLGEAFSFRASAPGSLSGVLADGTPFSFSFQGAQGDPPGTGPFLIKSGARITVNLVPEPSAALLVLSGAWSLLAARRFGPR